MSDNPHTILTYRYIAHQSIGRALYLVKTLGRYAMRLPNWPKDCALFYCKKRNQLKWIDDVDAGDAELSGNEIVSEEWEVWRND